MAVVVFPTPPFWFATAITIPMVVVATRLDEFRRLDSEAQRRKMVHCSTWNSASLVDNLFHVEQKVCCFDHGQTISHFIGRPSSFDLRNGDK